MAEPTLSDALRLIKFNGFRKGEFMSGDPHADDGRTGWFNDAHRDGNIESRHRLLGSSERSSSSPKVEPNAYIWMACRHISERYATAGLRRVVTIVSALDM